MSRDRINSLFNWGSSGKDPGPVYSGRVATFTREEPRMGLRMTALPKGIKSILPRPTRLIRNKPLAGRNKFHGQQDSDRLPN